MIDHARSDLTERLQALMDEERQRFDRVAGDGTAARALATELRRVA
jgi:hypothetical protein